MNDDFEQRLRSQPPRPIPGEWRAQILAAAKTPARTVSPSGFGFRISALFWPSPYAWAALATAWLLIALVNLSGPDHSVAIAQTIAQPSPDTLMALRAQKQLFTELIGPAEPPVADRPRPRTPQPHSERQRETSAA